MKKILVTGSTDGIGFETARVLANLGHDVWVHGRSLAKVQEAKNRLFELVPKAKLNSFVCDLSDFSTIREAVTQFKKENTHLDILINNAGVYLKEFSTSNIGVEMTMTINHLGPMLLTLLLKESFSLSQTKRIINVSSVAHNRGQLSEDNFSLTKNFEPYSAYASSKLANVFFTQKLAKIWGPEGFKVFCLHPGVINTKLLKIGFGAIGTNVEHGAETSVFLATDSLINISNGGYFENKKIKSVAELANNSDLENKFWNWSLNSINQFL